MNWWKEAIFDIDRGKVYELQGCYLGEPWKWKNMKQEHQLFYFKDSEWKSILSCSTNGSGFSEFFSPITTRKLRLILVNEKEPPAARELLFFFIFDTTKIQKYKLTNIHFGAAVSNIKKISGIFY